MLKRWVAAAALGLALSPRPSSAHEKRPLPDYDGRGANNDAGGGAWWVPRVALFPLWVVHEYGIRTPLREVVLVFDRNAADGTATRDRFDVRPIIELDYGFKPRFGFQVTGRHGGTASRMRADTFGPTSFRLGGALLAGGETSTFELYGEIVRRPDTIFHGLGPESRPDDRVRVALERGDVGARMRASVTRWLGIDAGLSIRGVAFRTPGVENDYVAFSQRLAIAIDPRPIERFGLGYLGKYEHRRVSGVQFSADGELVESPLPKRAWASYGGAATVDLTGGGRAFEFATVARFVDPLEGPSPPYTELATLGGDRYLRGHLQGRLYGRSAFVAYAEYRWPVWVFLDGFLRVDAGNVFGPHLQDLAPRLFRLSGTTGMRTLGKSGYLFELMAGVGTEPIDDGARVSSVRLLFSATQPL